LELDKNLKDIIGNKLDMTSFEEELKKTGYINMIQDGVIKALNGITTVEEVFSVTKEE